MNVLEMALKIESPGEGLPTWFSSVAIMSVTDKMTAASPSSSILPAASST